MEISRLGTLTTDERANRPQGLPLVGLGVVLAVISFVTERIPDRINRMEIQKVTPCDLRGRGLAVYAMSEAAR
jgi:hypothetical protein